MHVNILDTKYIYGMPFELLVFSVQKLFDLREIMVRQMPNKILNQQQSRTKIDIKYPNNKAK